MVWLIESSYTWKLFCCCISMANCTDSKSPGIKKKVSSIKCNVVSNPEKGIRQYRMYTSYLRRTHFIIPHTLRCVWVLGMSCCWVCVLTYPALQPGAGGGLDHIRRVHSHVETQHQRHTHSLHLREEKHNMVITSLIYELIVTIHHCWCVSKYFYSSTVLT